ncbi:MAG: hypothetical protein WCH83_02140 [Alphaproteobacteria bacterium]|jgi:hypothetical protein
MSEVKPMLESRTIWSNLVGFVCLAASIFGVETGLIDQGALAEALFQVATGLSFVASTMFRVMAQHKLSP